MNFGEIQEKFCNSLFHVGCRSQVALALQTGFIFTETVFTALSGQSQPTAFGTSITNSGQSYILQSSDGLHWTNVYETDTPIQIIGGVQYEPKLQLAGTDEHHFALQPVSVD